NCGHDRTCNLACPSCRKHVYVSNAQEQKKLIALQQRVLGEIGQGLRQLYIAGNGDPFASPVYMALLNSLTPEKYPRLRIHLMTNAQLWTPERWHALEHMNAMVTTANISVDAASSRIYAYNRRGGSWERLKQNLRFVSKLRAEGKLRFVTLSFVVQSNNYRQMPEFVEFAREHGFDQVWFQKFRDWGILGVKNVQELGQYAVHKPRHRDFSRFLSVLADLRLNDPIVAMYSLYPLRESALIVTKIPAGRVLYKIKRLLWN
ncbi:MAG: radical SAM protein, partial [Candidatus Omnitrophica bacterium]|nr:radical SAM protein [Candidatus Omnitrophota bacterium]